MALDAFDIAAGQGDAFDHAAITLEKPQGIMAKVGKELAGVGEFARNTVNMIGTLPADAGNFMGALADSVVQEDLSRENFNRNMERRNVPLQPIRNILNPEPTTERGKAMSGVLNESIAAPGQIVHNAVTGFGNQVINTEAYPNIVPQIAGVASIAADMLPFIAAERMIKAGKAPQAEIPAGFTTKADPFAKAEVDLQAKSTPKQPETPITAPERPQAPVELLKAEPIAEPALKPVEASQAVVESPAEPVQPPIRTFEPKTITEAPLPSDTAGLLPSKAENGQYYHAPVESVQTHVDVNGDGYLYRVANIIGIENGHDVGLPDYKHQFGEQSSKVHSFTTSLEDAKKILAESENPDTLIVYRIKPSDLSNDFTVQIPSDRGAGNTLHVQSPSPANMAKADVVYRRGEWKNDIPRIDERAGNAGTDETASQPANVRYDETSGRTGSETQPTPETTSIKNAATNAEREASGLSPIESPVGGAKPLADSFEQGKAKVESGEFNAATVESLIKNPRTLSDSESMALLYSKQRNRNAYDSATNALIEAKKTGDTAKIDSLTAERSALELERQNIDSAGKAVGTEWGRAGRARQEEIAQDYTLVRNIARAKAESKTGDIPEAVRIKIETLTNQLEETTAKIAERDERISKLEAEKAMRRIDKEVQFQRRKTSRATNKEALSTEFDSLTKQLNKVLGRVSANPMFNPEAISLMVEMAKNRIKAGIVTVEGVVDSIHKSLEGAFDKRDIRDAISGYGKTSEMSKEDIAVKLRELKTQARLISSLEDAQSGKAPLRTGLQREAPSDAARALGKQVKQAMKENGVETKTAEQQWKTALDAVKTRLRNQIADITKQLETGEKSPKKIGIKYDEEANTLKAKRDDLKAQLVEAEGKPEMSHEQRLNSYKTSLGNRIKGMESRLANGDYSKPVRNKLVLDQESQTLKARAEKLKELIDTEVEKQRLANRTPFEKGLDGFTKWRRAVILSGAQTIGKLTTAASMRMVITPLEEIIGGGLGKIPGLDRIAAKAPREGGFSAKGESAAFMQWFKKQTWEDVREVAKTGSGELDYLYGHKRNLPPEAIEFFGRIHGALKVMPKRAEFFRSVEKRAEHAVKQGKDLTDPTVQAEITANAYIDANRAIFMNDNAAVSAYRMLLRFAESRGAGGKLAATGLKTLLPIIKVPTNFVAETSSYAIGGAKAVGKLIASKGIENLTPEGADYVMRALKKQGIGAALVTIGYLNADSIGGYYQQGDKRKPGELKPEDLVIMGQNIPHFMLHTPALEALQIGATLARTEKAYGLKHKEGALTAGLLASAKGSLETVPFLEQPVRTMESMRNPESATRFTGDLTRSLIVPPDMTRIAKYRDTNNDVVTPRKAETLLDYVKIGIPGLRETLPVDQKKLLRSRQEHRISH